MDVKKDKFETIIKKNKNKGFQENPYIISLLGYR